ncbi:hypothetical protein CAL14_20125 [Bordetella genomosp. 9]|nr:hypothetical protein CAL14_20125 [Bordetella genomosp. 9]
MGGGGSTPEALARFPLKGATLADRRSRIRGVPDRGALVFMGGGGATPEALARFPLVSLLFGPAMQPDSPWGLIESPTLSLVRMVRTVLSCNPNGCRNL